MDLCIQPYDFDTHLEMLRYLLFQCGADPAIAYEAPANGYIVIDEFNYPVAAGFIRKCEGNIALLDGFVTNPCHNTLVRDKALDLLIKRLTKRAKGRKILAFTTDGCIIAKAIKPSQRVNVTAGH